MAHIRVSVTAELIAEANNLVKSLAEWWSWPINAALEELTHVDVDIDGNVDEGCVATIGGKETATLVLELGPVASAWLDVRWESGDERKPGEPFDFEIPLSDWLIGLVSEAQDDQVAKCRICGCDDDHACVGGCFWIEDPEGLGDLCSACGPDGEPS